MRVPEPLSLVLHLRDVKADTCHARGCVRNHAASRALPHSGKAPEILEQRFHFAGKIFRQLLVIVYDERAARFLDDHGVVQLLHVAVKGIGNVNGRAPSQFMLSASATHSAGPNSATNTANFSGEVRPL